MRSIVLPLLALCALIGCPTAAPSDDDDSSEDPTPAPTPQPINPWNEGPYDAVPWGVVRPFLFPGHDGDYNFEQEWTGEDSHVFVQDPSGGATAFWSSDLVEMLSWSPPNVQWFFVSGSANWEAQTQDMIERIDAALAELDAMGAEHGSMHWMPRMHVATVARNDIGGVVEEVLRDVSSQFGTGGGMSWQGFGIDRFQRVREIGLTRFVTQDGSAPDELWFVAHEPRYYNYEYERELHKAQHPADLTMPLWTGEQYGGGGRFVEIEVPEDIAGFDTLEIELTMGCVDGLDRNCFEWDYKADLKLCEVETKSSPPPPSCQPAVTDPDTGDVLTPADTYPCQCTSPYDGDVEREVTCNPVTDDDGTVIGGEWGTCPCACGPEVARWITAYNRQGTWLTDITPSLAFFQGGGPARLRFGTSYNYSLSAELRFSQRGEEPRPFAAVDLWTGGDFNSNYNANHAPIEFTVPSGTVKAEVVAFITGHGFGNDDANCAEFCPHAHHFQVNGGDVHSDEHPEADNYLGCIDQIDDGAVPNQYGTWYLGRGGWCPGLDVPYFRADVTDDLIPASTNTITYEASLNGQPPNNAGNIWLTSYLVFYR